MGWWEAMEVGLTTGLNQSHYSHPDHFSTSDPKYILVLIRKLPAFCCFIVWLKRTTVLVRTAALAASVLFPRKNKGNRAVMVSTGALIL